MGEKELDALSLKPNSYTEQENIVDVILTELGVKFERQYSIGKYSADFFLPETNWILEIDGPYGHQKKADKKRDCALLKLGIDKVFHIKEQDKKNIRKILARLFCQE